MFIYGLILYDGGVNVKVNAYFMCEWNVNFFVNDIDSCLG